MRTCAKIHDHTFKVKKMKGWSFCNHPPPQTNPLNTVQDWYFTDKKQIGVSAETWHDYNFV